MQLRSRGAAGGEPKAGDGARGARRRSTRRAPRRGSSSPVEDGPTVIVLPGPAARAARDVGAGAARPRRCRGVLERAEPYVVQTVRMFGIPESEIAKSLREIEAETDLSPLEITTCLRRGELEIDIRHRPGAEAGARGARRRPGRAPRALRLQHRRLDDRRAGRGAAARPPQDRPRRIVHRRAARGAARRPARAPRTTCRAAWSPTRTRPRSSCSASPPELIERHGAVSPEVAEAMADGAAGALRRRPRGRDHRNRRARRRHRGEAGRLRLLLRQGRRTGR